MDTRVIIWSLFTNKLGMLSPNDGESNRKDNGQ